MLKEGKRLKTWEEIKAERTTSSATKTRKSWAEIKKERGYVEPQSSKKEEQAAGATPALPAEKLQQPATTPLDSQQPATTPVKSGVGKFLLEKGASGAAESSEGFLNAMSRIGQMLENQRRVQELQRQAATSRVLGNVEESNQLVEKLVEAGKIASGRDQQLVDPFSFGDKYAARVEEKYADANLSKGQRLLGDVAQGVGGLVPSIAANVVAPGSGMVVMTAGAFGNAVQEAKKAGADDATANAYGAAVAAVEAATEKIWGGMGGLFGTGAIDDVVKSAIANNIKSGAARAALTTVVSMLGEGAEEFLAEYGQLIANKLTIKTDDRQVWSRETLGDAGKSALIGAIIGGLMNIGESIEAGKTPQQAVEAAAEEAAEKIKKEMPAENAKATAEQETEAVKIAAGGEETTANNDTDETALKAAEEKLKKAVEANRAKAAEREEEIPKIELKGIEEEQTTNTESEEEILRIELPGIKETAKTPARASNESQRDIARRIGDYIEKNEPKRSSPAELGIENGGDIESITVLEKPLTEMFDFSEASEIAERAGYEPVYFSGMLQNSNGGISRWGIAGNKLYIQADSANYTAADIAKEAVERSKTNETISDRGRDERYAGLSAGGQTERVSQQGGSQARRAAARANKAASYAAERASDYISGGSSEQTLKIIPAADYDGELKGIDKTLRKMGAKKVYFTVGSIGIVNPATGESANVSGVYDSDSGVMMVRADSNIYTAQQLAMHEAFHYIANADSTIREDAYNRLLAEMSEGEMDELTARYQVAYGNIYGDNIDAYVDEILADAYAGINRENLGADRYRSTVNSAVMAAARPETEQRQTNGPNERYTFGGANANNANLAALRQAQEMEKQGVAAETIFQATGWYIGADGKWRFEIDDSQMKYSRRGDLGFRERNKGYDRYRQLMQKAEDFMLGFSTEQMTEAEMQELTELRDVWSNTFRTDGKVSPDALPMTKLADYISHEELFRNYPQLRNTSLVFGKLQDHARGQYDPEKNIITLREDLRNAPEDTIIHEIQHAIQRAENFATGSTPEYFGQNKDAAIKPAYRAELEAAQAEVERWEQRFAYEWGENSVNLTLASQYAELNERQYEEMGENPDTLRDLETIEAIAEEGGWNDLLTGYAQAKAELSLKRTSALRNRFDNYTAYRNTAGEIEARDAARRRTMTTEQRRATMPDVGNEDTVFAEKAGYYVMSRNEQDSIKEQLREHQDRLNAMEVVSKVNTREYAGLDTRRAREKLVSEMKKTGYKVDRQGFGEIQFEENEINNSLNYKEKDPLAEDARRTGFLALQSVLKRGIEIDGHDMHKGRSYDTVTIAAPVEINGKRGNMAVVVKRTKGNRYKVHRILTPEGNNFALPEMANAEVNTVGAFTNNSQSLGGSAPAISSASTTNVAESGQDVKERFSVDENQTAERDEELEGILSDLQAATEENAVKAETATEGKKTKEIISVKPVATADEAIERKLLNAETEAAEEEAPENLAAKMSNSRGDFTASPAVEKLGVKVVNSIGKYNNVKQLISNVKASHSLAAARKKAETRLKVTAKEKLFARGIANGTYSESDIPEGWDKRTVLEMSEWYMAERNFGESYIDKLKQALAVDLDAATAQMFEGIDESKVSPAIVLNHRTVQRNMLKIFGAEKGAEINRWLFDPVNQNEAERIRFINRQYDKVRTFEDQSGKQRALNKEEREMVQRVMEGRVVLDTIAELENKQDIYDATDNLLAGEDIGDLGLEFGLTLEEQEIVESYANWLKVQDRLAAMDNTIINNAVEKYTALFDDYYDAINDFLAAHGYQPIGFIKGYVPHLQPEKNQTALQSAFEKLGFNADVSTLPASIAGLTGEFKPNKKWNPYFLHRNGTVTQFDIAEAFESYVSHMADMLYHMDDIMRIRNAVKYFRRTYSPEEIRNSIEWAEKLRTMPKSERVAFLYDEGIISASTGEISNADSKELLNKYIDDMYGKIENTSKFNNLVVYLENYANILAGKQSIADRGEEASLGRKILNVGNKITRIFSRANVAGNISSALNQSSQLPMILAENGIKNTTAAFKDIVTGNLRKQGWAEDSDYLTTKKGVDFIVSTPGEMFVDVIFKPMELVDGMLSTLAVRSSYLDAIKRGMSHEEAMQYADRKAVNIMGDRSKGAKPLAFESKKPISSMLHMFQVEALNSWDHLISDLPGDFRQIEATEGRNKAAAALASVIAKTLISTFALNRLAEKLYGGTPAPFDIFGLTANFIASGQSLGTNSYLEALIDKVMMELFGTKLFDTDDDELELLADEEFNTAAAFEDLGYNLSNEIPFLSNLSALLGLGDKTLPLPDLTAPAKTITSGIKNKNVLEALDGAVEALGEIVPAGRQAVKTYTGAKTIIQGGKMKGYGEKARLQYPVRRTAGNITQALLFGTSGLQENQDYYASGRGTLTAKETMLWKTLVANGADEEEAYKVIYSTKGEDVKDYEKLQIMAAPTEWDNDLKYEAMMSVVSDSAGYKIRVLQNYEISADLYAEATAAMYDAAAERIAELPEDERPERVNITQEDAKKVLKAMSGISNQEKAMIWQMTNAGWAVGKNPFSSTVGKKAKAEYEAIKERAEKKKEAEDEEEIPRITLRGLE